MNSVLARRAGKSGGSGIGGILGAVGAAVAAPFTGGASLAAMPAIIGAGHAVGSTVGGLVAPGKAASDTGVAPPDSAISRRASSGHAEQPSAVLEGSLKALHETQDPNMQEKFGVPLFKAYTMALGKERGMS